MSRSGCWWFPMSLINSQEKQPALLDQVHDLHIAMEPGLGGQEKWCDSKSPPLLAPRSQWSLALAARKRRVGVAAPTRGSLMSQWSLALAARKSLVAVLLTWGAGEVAMEPGLGGQEKGQLTLAEATVLASSQWSLALAARKSNQRQRPRPPLARSQWSLALAARKSLIPSALFSSWPAVAMEPGLGGQEKLSSSGRSPRRGMSRNGAWPWRPGKGRTVDTTESTSSLGRNGAWPWRPGKAGC